MTSEGTFVPEAALTEEYNEECKNIRDFMVNLWASAKKIKCGDAGYTPSKDDPFNPPADKEDADAKK